MRLENVMNIMERAHITWRANARTRQDMMIGDFSRVNDEGDSMETEKVETGLEVGEWCCLDRKENRRDTVGFPLRSTPITRVSWARL